METAKKYAPGYVKLAKTICSVIVALAVFAGFVTVMDNGQPEVLFGLLFGAAILCLIVWIQFLIACEFFVLAVDKGYTRPAYLGLCFFLSGIGYLLVVAMPNKKANTQATGEDFKASLERIAKLKDSGVLTEEEAVKMRADILSDI